MIPLKDLNPTRRPAYLTMILIAINVGVFLFIQRPTSPAVEQQEFVYEYAAIPCEITTGEPITVDEIVNDTCVDNNGSNTNREPFPDKRVFLAVVLSMFLHGGWLHLAGNMLFLWIFGNNIEDRLGAAKYLAFYILGGLVAAVAHVMVDTSSVIPVVGASGAIAAVMGAYLIWYPNAPIKTIFIVFFIFYFEVRAKWLLTIWFVTQFFTAEGSGVAWVAHVGGFVFGVVAASADRAAEPGAAGPDLAATAARVRRPPVLRAPGRVHRRRPR